MAEFPICSIVQTYGAWMPVCFGKGGVTPAKPGGRDQFPVDPLPKGVPMASGWATPGTYMTNGAASLAGWLYEHGLEGV